MSGALLALLTILGFTAGLPTHLSPAVDSSTEIPATSTLPGSHQDGQSPHFVGADNLTDLSLPKTVLSSVDDLIETGGVVQASPDNLTIYNLGISMRLLGGQVPHDELLGADGTVLSYWSFWGVEANLTGGWVPLLPTTNDFTVLGTNSSGAHVIRQMRLESGLYSGDFQITYKATSAGLLKWNLGFIPTTSGQYRLTYSWLNLPRRSFLQADLRSLTAGYGSGNYTFSWSDVPSGLASTPSLSSNLFSLAIGLGTVAADQKITIDPTVASNVYSSATGYTFQRKIFFDPKAGNYWAFYDDGMNTRTKYSHDGTFWSDPSSGGTLPSQFNTPYVDLEMSGQQVIAAVGQSYGNTLPSPWSHTVQGLYSVGTITGTSISWSSIYGIDSGQSWTCGNGSSSCSMTLGIRYVNVNIGPDGTLTFAYNFYVAVDVMVCTGTQYYSYLYVRYKGATRAIAGTGGGQYCIPVDSWDQDRNVVLPYSQGRVRVVFQYRGTGDTVALQSNWFDGANVGPGETIESTVPDGPEFSAAPDSTYDINVAYKMNDGTVNHAFLSSAATSWIHYPNIFSGLGASPTVTVDQSTNDVYVFALRSGGIVMRSKAVSRNWTDTSAVFSVTFRNTPTNLTSNPISASATNSSSILLFWTEGTGPYIAAFACLVSILVSKRSLGR